MAFQKNQILTLTVTDINHLGFGIAKPDGFVVFIADTVPGDTAEVRIIKVNKSFAVARLLRILTPSPHRAASPRCSLHACTACAYKNVDYDYELACKHTAVLQAFRKAGLAHIPVDDVVSNRRILHYRNKAQYPVSRRADGSVVIGFYAPKSHRVCEAAACPLQPPVFFSILQTIRGFIEEHRLSVYDESAGDGWLRHIYLRRGEESAQILLTLVVTDLHFPLADAFVKCVRQAHADIVGILLNLQDAPTNVILGERYQTLWGSDSLSDTLCGVRLTLSAASFYQVNHDAAEWLYRKARDLAAPKKDECLLDLFCGVGSIGLSMADAVKQVVGVEIVDSAVRCARHCAEQSGIANAEFFTADAADTDRLLTQAEAALGHALRPDIVVLDPPRKGCDKQLLTYLAELSPSRIVYISCNPETLARDVAILAPLGYACGTVTPVDLFAGTGHVETVVLLSKGEIDSKKVRVEFSLEGMDMSGFQKDATYGQIKERVLEQTGLKVSSLYIAQVKQKHGIIERENYNKPKSENARQPQCPPEKEKAITEALKYFGMI